MQTPSNGSAQSSEDSDDYEEEEALPSDEEEALSPPSERITSGGTIPPPKNNQMVSPPLQPVNTIHKMVLQAVHSNRNDLDGDEGKTFNHWTRGAHQQSVYILKPMHNAQTLCTGKSYRSLK